MARRLIVLGVVGIFGGEAFCLLGPLRYQPQVHLICHAIFYSGVALVALGAVRHWRTRNQSD